MFQRPADYKPFVVHTLRDSITNPARFIRKKFRSPRQHLLTIPICNLPKRL